MAGYIENSTSHYENKDLAIRFTDLANRERLFSRDLAFRVHSIAEKTIIVVGIILAAAIVGSLLVTQFSTATIATVLEPVMLKTFQGIGVVLSLSVPTILYNVYQRSSHLGKARYFEQMALNASARAAETPAWRDWGLASGLLGRLFWIGNSVSRNESRHVCSGRAYCLDYC